MPPLIRRLAVPQRPHVHRRRGAGLERSYPQRVDAARIAQLQHVGRAGRPSCSSGRRPCRRSASRARDSRRWRSADSTGPSTARERRAAGPALTLVALRTTAPGATLYSNSMPAGRLAVEPRPAPDGWRAWARRVMYPGLHAPRFDSKPGTQSWHHRWPELDGVGLHDADVLEARDERKGRGVVRQRPHDAAQGVVEPRMRDLCPLGGVLGVSQSG